MSEAEGVGVRQAEESQARRNYYDGWAARMEGRTAANNPHERGSVPWRQWRAGYDEACDSMGG